MRPWNVPLLVDVLTAEVDELTAGMKACKLMEAEQAREAQEAEAEARRQPRKILSSRATSRSCRSSASHPRLLAHGRVLAHSGRV